MTDRTMTAAFPHDAAPMNQELASSAVKFAETAERTGYDGFQPREAQLICLALRYYATELNRRKGDPMTRLHNIAEALQDDAVKSPYTLDEWIAVDMQIVELQNQLTVEHARAEALRRDLDDARRMLRGAENILEECRDGHDHSDIVVAWLERHRGELSRARAAAGDK